MTSQSALSYEEPGIRTILILSGFLLVLNLANSLLDRLVYCGLIGQIFIGVAWGMPGAQWLTLEAQEMMQQLGYLGLLLLVYEGKWLSSFVRFFLRLGRDFNPYYNGVLHAVIVSGIGHDGKAHSRPVSHHLSISLYPVLSIRLCPI